MPISLLSSKTWKHISNQDRHYLLLRGLAKEENGHGVLFVGRAKKEEEDGTKEASQAHGLGPR
jgi:hypothetical protein